MPLSPITLYGEQKRVLFLPPTEPIQIKGVAGSGKTTVSLYRAKHLLETQSNLFQEAKIVIFTFNTTLTAYIEAIKSHITGGYQKDTDLMLNRSYPGLNVLVINFHKWAFRFLANRNINAFIDLKTFKQYQFDTVQKAVTTLSNENPTNNFLKKRVEFFQEEISWMKGKMFLTKEEYLNSPRIGRGTTDRIISANREFIWEIFQEYNRELTNAGKLDFDDYAIYCLREINKDNNFVAPFTHIIVDEAQDLSKAQILCISKIVSAETRSITIIADSAQKIYKSGFTWTEVGIQVRGARTLSLKKNYRNTEAISLAANSLLSHDPDPSEFTVSEPARKGGNKPQVSYFNSWNEEASHLINELNQLDNQTELTVILHRDWNGMRRISQLLSSRNIANEIINENSLINFKNNKVKICTLSSVKGLEFDNVFIVDVNDNTIPFPQGFNDDNDEVHISTERRLLYTAMTRAREKLFLLSYGNPSRYLAEIDETLIDRVGNAATIVADDLPF